MDWDIHSNGHCFHPSELDAFVERLPATSKIAWKVLGPFSRSSGMSDEIVRNSLRSLVEHLESATPGRIVVFGTASNAPARGYIEVLGCRTPFHPNWTLRSSLWDEIVDAQRRSAYAKEWQYDQGGVSLAHVLGFKVSFCEQERRVVATTRWPRSSLNSYGLEDVDLEMLSRKAIWLHSGFDYNTVFRRFEHLHLPAL